MTTDEVRSVTLDELYGELTPEQRAEIEKMVLTDPMLSPALRVHMANWTKHYSPRFEANEFSAEPLTARPEPRRRLAGVEAICLAFFRPSTEFDEHTRLGQLLRTKFFAEASS